MKTLRCLTNIAFVTSLAILASCSSENELEVNNEKNENNGNATTEKLVFSASIEGNETTRAKLNSSDNTLHWEAGDQIAVFSPKENKYEAFTIDSKYNDKTIAYFVNDMSSLKTPDATGDFSYYYAFYPYEAVTSISGSNFNRANFTIKTEQTVTDGYTYDRSAVLMMARATPSEKAFEFKNVNALLKVTIKNNADGKVKYIKILSNNSSKTLTGNFYANITGNGVNTYNVSDNNSYVQLEIPASPDNNPVDYYLSVFQNNCDQGFTLLLESEFGRYEEGSQSIYQRVYTGNITFNKSNIYDMGSYDVKTLPFIEHAVDLNFASGTIWVTRNVDTTPQLVENWYDYGGYYTWGATAQQSAYNSNNYTLGNDIYTTYQYKGPKDTSTKTYYILKSEYDVASQISGGIYCMPTKTQIEELIALTKTYYMSNNKWNGYNGIKFTGYKNRYLWLPAGGYFLNETFQQGSINEGSMCYYWSRNRYDVSADYAYCLDFQNNGEVYHDLGGSNSGNGRDRRYCGKNIRPIVKNVGIEKAKGFPSNY